MNTIIVVYQHYTSKSQIRRRRRRQMSGEERKGTTSANVLMVESTPRNGIPAIGQKIYISFTTKQTKRRGKEHESTHTPPATPPATSDLQMLVNERPGSMTPSSLASFASSARFTIVLAADSPVPFRPRSSDAIAQRLRADFLSSIRRRWQRGQRKGGGGRSACRRRSLSL